MKKARLYGIIIILMVFSLSACADDWYEYENKNYEVSVKLEGDVFCISAIESELLAIANEYDDDVKLTYAKYTFEDKSSGTAEFQFFREYEKSKTSFGVVITLHVNLSDKSVYKVNYTEGQSKRVRGYINDIKHKNVSASEVYDYAIAKTSLNEEEYHYIVAVYCNDSIDISHFTKEMSSVGHIKYGS